MYLRENYSDSLEIKYVFLRRSRKEYQSPSYYILHFVQENHKLRCLSERSEEYNI